MTEALIAAAVLAFWLLVVWRVAVERGRVGVSAELRRQLLVRALVARFTASMQDVTLALAEALAPAMRKAAHAQLAEVERRGYVTPIDDDARGLPLSLHPVCPRHEWRQPLALWDEAWVCPFIGCDYQTAAAAEAEAVAP